MAASSTFITCNESHNLNPKLSWAGLSLEGWRWQLSGATHYLMMMPQGSPKENRFNMIQYVDKDGKGFLEGQVHISREDQKK
jgi:hypothetical protein